MYLKESEHEREREISYTGSLPKFPQQPGLIQAETRGRGSICVSTWVQEAAECGPSSALFSDTLSHNWIRSRIAGTWTGILMLQVVA